MAQEFGSARTSPAMVPTGTIAPSSWRMPAVIAALVLAGGIGVAGFQGWLAKSVVWPHLQKQDAVVFRRPARVASAPSPQLVFYTQQAVPLLRQTADKNREALARAQANLGRDIDAYRGGIEPFLADLRSWGTQRRSVLRWLGGWWNSDQRLATYIDAKFRKHLFSETTIAANVADALRELRDDLRANENQLLVELRDASARSRLSPAPAWSDDAGFGRQVAERAIAASGQRPRDAVTQNVFLFMGTAAVASTIVPDVVSGAISGIVGSAVARTGSIVAAEVGLAAADIGGSTAAGSEVPVIGNVAGFCVGMVSAVLVQHFAQAAEDEKLRTGLNAYVDSLKLSLVGSAGDPGELSRIMATYVAQVDAAQADLVRRQALQPSSEP